MKKIFFLFLLFAVTSKLYAQKADSAATTSKAKIAFEKASHDFGDIKQGDKVDYTFKFKNTGTDPLIISNVLTSCGCTATKWPKEPIAPGKSGEISATFNSAGKSGKQNKVITVVSNASNGQEKVSIICNVLPNEVKENSPVTK